MKYFLVVTSFFVFACSQKKEKKNPNLDFKTEMEETLNEVSGLSADGQAIWAITDKPKSVMYKLDTTGKLLQEINIKDVDAIDVEAVTHDDEFVYLGDVGDNEGSRIERLIIKVSKAPIKNASKEETTAEVIKFSFSEDSVDEKKKKNNYDCEAMLSYGDSIYLFTKRREDNQTELFSVSKTPGTYIAHSMGIYDCQGLITDAAINKSNDEVALIGYNKGHKFPFLLFFKNFKGNNFFSGTPERVELADKDWDWQLESITYGAGNKLYFACEQTKEVKSTFYTVNRNKVMKLNKKQAGSKEKK